MSTYSGSLGGIQLAKHRDLHDFGEKIRRQGSTILGTVRYARSVGYEFHVGIEAEVLQTAIGTTRGEELDLTPLFPIDALRLRRA